VIRLCDTFGDRADFAMIDFTTPVSIEDREKHAFSVRDRTCTIGYSHYVCDQGDMGCDLC
jgi:hypothetical protein